MSVIILAEQAGGHFKKPAFEALSYGFDLAQSLGVQPVAVVLGTASAGELEKLKAYGPAKIVHVAQPVLDVFNDALHAAALADVAAKNGARAVVLPQTYNGRAIAPRLAVKLDAALVSGVTGLPSSGAQGLHFKRPAYSGKAIQEIATSAATVVLTVKANSWAVSQRSSAATVETFEWQPSGAPAVKVLETQQLTDKVSLTEAEVVVSGGRGLKGPENWGMIEELAEQLGAATACSKPVADVHWRPHHEHVGQTGIQIAPNVYIAVGISGAIQHLAGVNSSKTIIVINKDPEAPFFKAADYGIVGDAFEVLPALSAAIRKRINGN